MTWPEEDTAKPLPEAAEMALSVLNLLNGFGSGDFLAVFFISSLSATGLHVIALTALVFPFAWASLNVLLPCI